MNGNLSGETRSRMVSKLLVVLLSVAICAAFMPLLSDSADAAGKKPAKVKSVTVKVSPTNKVSVSWKKAKRAKKYEVQIKDAKSGLVASKKVKSKKCSFNGQSETTYIVKVRGLKGKKKGKWSAKKSVKTNSASSAAQKAAEAKAAAAEKAAAEAKAAQQAAEKAAKEASDRADELQKLADELDKIAKEKAEEAKEAKKAADIVKAIEVIDELTDEQIVSVEEAYDELSAEAKGLISEDMSDLLHKKALQANRHIANAYVKSIADLNPVTTVDDCATWANYHDYSDRVKDAIEEYDNVLTLNQQMLVGNLARVRLDICSFELQKAYAVLVLEGWVEPEFLRENYFKAERKAIIEILFGVKNDVDQGVAAAEGAISKIRKANTEEEIETIKDTTEEELEKISQKPAALISDIEKLSTDYATITEDNVDEAKAAVEALKKKYRRLSRLQKEDITNYVDLISVENNILAFENSADKATAKNALEQIKDEEGNYYTDDWAVVSKAIDDGKAAIDALDPASSESIRAILVDTLDTISEVPTKVDTVRSMIVDCLDNYLYNLTDDNIDDAREAVSDAMDAFQEDLDEAQQAKIKADRKLMREARELVNNVDNYELNKAKGNAIAELEEYYDHEGDYLEYQWGIIKEAISDGIEEIRDAETVEAVNGLLKDIEEDIADVPTGVELVKLEIKEIYDIYLKDGLNRENIEFFIDETMEIRGHYNDLTEEQKAEIENIGDLDDLEKDVYDFYREMIADQAEYIDRKIDEIDFEHLIKDRGKVFIAASLFREADGDVKALVQGVETLRDALNTIEKEWPEMISEMILALNDRYVALNHDDAAAVKKFYDVVSKVKEELDDYDKKRVEYDLDNRVVKKYRNMLKNLQVSLIEDMIIGLLPVEELEFSEANMKAAYNARQAYNNADDEVKAILDEQEWTDKLVDIENKMDALFIEDLIDGLPDDPDEVTTDDADYIHAIRAEYREASDAVKAYIDKETYIEKLKKCEAKLIEVMIDALPDPTAVTEDDRAAIEAARAELKGATQPVKKLVSDDAKTKLKACEDALPQLQGE